MIPNITNIIVLNVIIMTALSFMNLLILIKVLIKSKKDHSKRLLEIFDSKNYKFYLQFL